LAVWPIALILNGFSPALALADEDPSAAETAAARSLAVDGLKLAKAGQCREAVDKLERAEKLHHSAIVLARLGECYVNLGRLVQGSESLRKVLREPLPPEPSPALQQAYERAQQLVQETKSSIAGLTISVAGVKDAALTLLVDGSEVPATVIGVELPVDPGEHVVEVRAPGFLKATGRAKLGTGEKQTISVELKRDPNAASVDAPAATPNPAQSSPGPTVARANTSTELGVPPSEPVKQGSSTRTWGYVSYGVGAVGLGLGLVFGRAAMQDKTQLESDCPNKVCNSEQADRLDAAKTKGIVSTVGFGVGAAGVVLGTVLVLSGSSDSSASGSRATPGKTARSSFRPRAAIGLGSVEIGADF
jgi:hypothetical protein